MLKRVSELKIYAIPKCSEKVEQWENPSFWVVFFFLFFFFKFAHLSSAQFPAPHRPHPKARGNNLFPSK